MFNPNLLQNEANGKGSACALPKTAIASLANDPSVLRHLRIHSLRPSRNPARQILHLREPSLPQELDRLRAAPAHLAVNDNLSARIQFLYRVGQIVQRNQMSADVADLIFVRLAHIENKKILLRIQPPL